MLLIGVVRLALRMIAYSRNFHPRNDNIRKQKYGPTADSGRGQNKWGAVECPGTFERR